MSNGRHDDGRCCFLPGSEDVGSRFAISVQFSKFELHFFTLKQDLWQWQVHKNG